jgi:hypothetical protein
MSRWKWALLIFELVLFAVILILPQVELPEFPVHGGTTPIAAKSRVASAPVQPVIAGNAVSTPQFDRKLRSEAAIVPVSSPLHIRLSMICTLLC